MSHSGEPTVAAIATPPGQGGVAVIRVSGERAWEIARKIFSKPETNFQPGRFYHGWIVENKNTKNEKRIDEILLLMFRTPHSFTGEDVVEIHCHGGEIISRKILSLCFEVGAEAAPPGEFTRRAFLNGKMDLTQAESVMDLVSAKSGRIAEMASANLGNRSFAHYMDGLGESLMSVQSQIVAHVDFPDEVDEPSRQELSAQLQEVSVKLKALEEASRRNSVLRHGLKVALLGKPNSGKSSLFNRLLASERSIVTEIAGTTRDVITETLDINGVAVTLVDTAGLREVGDVVETLGIERSWQAAGESRAVLYVYDVEAGLTEEDSKLLEKLQGTLCRVVANKVDTISGAEAENLRAPDKKALEKASGDDLRVSAMTGEGIPDVFQWLETIVAGASAGSNDLMISMNVRQTDCLEMIRDNLDQTMATLADHHLPLDLATVPLTEALRKLDELMGRDTTEEVLTSVFRQFCVGK